MVLHSEVIGLRSTICGQWSGGPEVVMGLWSTGLVVSRPVVGRSAVSGSVVKWF